MRSEAEIHQALDHLRQLIDQEREHTQDMQPWSQESGRSYVEAMYYSAALHALQWAVGELPELLLPRSKRLPRGPS